MELKAKLVGLTASVGSGAEAVTLIAIVVVPVPPL